MHFTVKMLRTGKLVASVILFEYLLPSKKNISMSRIVFSDVSEFQMPVKKSVPIDFGWT